MQHAGTALAAFEQHASASDAPASADGQRKSDDGAVTPGFKASESARRVIVSADVCLSCVRAHCQSYAGHSAHLRPSQGMKQRGPRKDVGAPLMRMLQTLRSGTPAPAMLHVQPLLPTAHLRMPALQEALMRQRLSAALSRARLNHARQTAVTWSSCALAFTS